MAPKSFLGEFEQMVLLAILQRGEDANALEIRRELEESANRKVAKGAFYTTLNRLERKKYLSWTARTVGEGRSGLPQRHFKVTPQGVAELQKSRDALQNLWQGLDEVWEAR
ncbi:MAG: helix-turn-helix transcriptional regulator [Gemmatimonadetes bacterium]|nr:helix-turn-helix transcriptional regulator [Gemmatimonadota bacterium]MEE2847734.1 helix-turn-helix transcriptional regulator [Gemmatimonadota bacterium]